jgi:hypothetical protein
VSVFYRRFGQALTRALRDALTASWKGQTCDLRLEQDGSAIRMFGEYELITPLGWTDKCTARNFAARFACDPTGGI